MIEAGHTKLHEVLERSRGLGFLGPGPVSAHVAHAERYLLAIRAYRAEHCRGVEDADGGPVRVVDLGAGGGVPSLPMLVVESEIDVLLVDAAQRRTAFCAWALTELGVSDRARVWTGRAETLSREGAVGGGEVTTHDVAVARGFGPPASTLECAAPLVRDGGWCVISEPPGGRRWPGAIEQLGLQLVRGHEGVAVFERSGPVGDGYPRSAKLQKRNPLFML